MYEIIDAVVRNIAETFNKGRSWASRVYYRITAKTVQKLVDDSLWIVKGIPQLGDHYTVYEIRKIDNKFSCPCLAHPWGRSRYPCTHIGAVMTLVHILNLCEKYRYYCIIDEKCKILDLHSIKVLYSTKFRKIIIFSKFKKLKILDNKNIRTLELTPVEQIKETIENFVGAGAGIRTRE